MKHPHSKENRESYILLPTRFIAVAVVALCLVIMGSAVFTFMTFLRLRAYYLSNRGHEIAEAIDAQTRGPGRRNNPVFWQSVFESNFATYSDSVAFLALVDQNGKILAYKGISSTSALNSPQNKARDVYRFEEPLAQPRNPRHDASPTIIAGWRIQIGLYSSETDFIRRQALLQITVSGLAVIALFVLSVNLLRMLNRFLDLKVREGAEAQLKSLGIMAASLAHEIRNPLGAMKGLTQLAQEELPADHAAQTHLRTIVSEAERLEKLVTDLLDFARAKEPQISEFNLMDLLSDIKTMLQSRVNASKAVLQFPIDPNPFNLRSDPAGLRQVLLNVLINAIDATPADGVIALTVRHQEDHKSILIRIDDSGEGFGQKNPEELFQPFVTTKARGTGLGLAVSKQIVESLGGSLNLENLPQRGARCSMVLPVR